MRSRFTLLLIAAGCAAESAPPARAPIAVGPPADPPVLVREAPDALGGGADLFAATAPREIGGAVWLLDSGNDRLVRFDTALTRAASVGREGEGPGEIQLALDLIVHRGRLAVAETGNGRVSLFDTSGAFVRTTASALVPKSLAAVGGELVVAPGPDGFYTSRVGNGAGHARIPEPLVRLARADPDAHRPADPLVAAPRDGPLYVLDGSVLALAVYDAAGTLLEVRLLPDPFRRALLERRSAEMKEWGARARAFVSSPVTKRMSVDDRGRLLIPFSLPDHWGLLIDPATWTARPLALPESEPARGILWSASDAALHAGRLWVLSQDRLYRFDARGWR